MAKHGENIYKRKDGRYEGRYVIGRAENGRTKFGYIYGYQYSEVRNKLFLKKAQLLKNSGENACRLSLIQWMQRWLHGEVRSRVKETSYAAYCNLWSRHIAPQMSHLLLDRITADDVRELMAALHEKKLASSTQNAVLRLLKSAMNAAWEEGHVRRNPCLHVRPKQNDHTEQRVLSTAEQNQLTQHGNLAALLGLYTGLRLGEVCALQWTDVDWEGRTIAVRRTVQRTVGQNGLRVGTPKTAQSRRVIPVPEFLLNMLAQMERQSQWIFGHGDLPAEPRTVQRRLAHTAQALGMQGVHFHTLRHTFATRLMELGVDVKTVSVLLGHSNTRTTLEFYAHSLPEQQRSAVNKLAQMSRQSRT